MDIRVSTSDRIYAESLLKASDDYTAMLENLAELIKLKNSSEDFRNLADNPTIPLEIKFEVVDEVLKNFDSKIINFVKVLLKKNKFKNLDNIIQAYNEAVMNITNRKSITIVSAIELSNDIKNKIIEKLETKYNKIILASWEISEDIIGGLIVKSDDEVIDCSIKNKLHKLSKI